MTIGTRIPYSHYFFGGVVLALVLAACNPPRASQVLSAQPAQLALPPAAASTASLTQAPVDVFDTCPVTQPPAPPFVPSGPYAPQLPGGAWRQLPYNNGAYTQKVFWWRQGYSVQAEPQPNLTVTGRRLNAAAPPLIASRATNGWQNASQPFMLVGVDIPTIGCWQITGHLGKQKLSFVVWVGP